MCWRAVPRPTARRRRLPATAPLTVCGLVPGDRDSLKEERLRMFRIVYAFDNWAAHRSTRRYLRHFLGIFSSRIVSGLRWPLLLVALEATCVCLYEGALKGGMLPAGFRSIQIKAPMLFSLSSFALSLLLVFRTNQAYARFDEARRLWSIMHNRCKDAMRQSVSYLGPSQLRLLMVLSRWLRAMPWVLKNHVREAKNWKMLEEILEPAELQLIMAARSPPLAALQVLTELYDRAPISTKQRLRVDGCLSDLSDTVGACERILTTPIPVSYTRHTARFLVIWLALLPFSIFASCGWVTVFSSVVLGFFLLSIEEIGVTIEEPFNILPLEDLNTMVAADLQQAVQQMDAVIALADAATGGKRAAPPEWTPAAAAAAAVHGPN
ncbi:hypothetical protein D9Q98_002665 [Chlorella vulgaris]|uniref:Uncharacterized protein n=1 Tax=Chlorella vulgaris TaxID=3077 RepID=A0A9D4TTZ0_CHLVU|nr:hypothetical protein D9Q98_002665 [Chlorella vulgaris]